MTSDKQERIRQILDLAVSKSALRHYAYCPDEQLPATIFIDLAGHWVVHSELGLDYAVKVKVSDLPDAFRRYGMYCMPQNNCDSVYVYAWYVNLLIRVLSDGSTQIRVLDGSHPDSVPSLSLTPESLAQLVHFIDKSIPVVMERVEEMRQVIKSERMAEDILVRGLSIALDQLGVSHILTYKDGNVEACIGLEAQDLELRFTVPLEDVPEMAAKIGDLIAAANIIGNEYWSTGMSIHEGFEL